MSQAETQSPRQLSHEPIVGWILLAIAVPLGSWLIWEIHRTIGLSDPHFWDLLKNDRVFDVAMLDFCLTAGWAALVIIERANLKTWQFWVSMSLFCVIPSLGIALFLILQRASKGRPIDPASFPSYSGSRTG